MDDHPWSEFAVRYDLPPVDGPVRNYLIATTQRTGSHYLAHLLGARGVVGVPFEYLNDHRILLEMNARGWENTERNQIRLIDEMKRRRAGSAGWFGIKAHWHTWREVTSQPELAQTVQPERYVYLIREDRVAQAASLALAEQTGWWVDASQMTKATAEYSASDIVRALETIDVENAAWQEYFARGRECLMLSYEEIVTDPDAAVSAVCSHLGVVEVPAPKASFPEVPPRPEGLVAEWAARFRSGA